MASCFVVSWTLDRMKKKQKKTVQRPHQGHTWEVSHSSHLTDGPSAKPSTDTPISYSICESRTTRLFQLQTPVSSAVTCCSTSLQRSAMLHLQCIWVCASALELGSHLVNNNRPQPQQGSIFVETYEQVGNCKQSCKHVTTTLVACLLM